MWKTNEKRFLSTDFIEQSLEYSELYLIRDTKIMEMIFQSIKALFYLKFTVS